MIISRNLGIICFVVLAGCVGKSAVEDEVVFHTTAVEFVGWLLLGVVGLVIGLVLRKAHPKFGIPLIVVGVLALVYGVPNYFFEKFVITNEGFSRSAIVSGAPNYTLRFDEITGVGVRKLIQTSKIAGVESGRDFVYDVRIMHSKHGLIQLSLRDAISREAATTLFDKFGAKGIPVAFER